MAQLEEKIKQLETLLELSYISIPINHLKKAGWSDEEICIIIDHFMNGGMLSEIIAPAKNTAGNDKIHLSVDALQDFDAFFSNRKRQIPGLVDRIAETRLNKEINEMNNEKRLKEIHGFLGELEFQTRIPDFLGAWTSKLRVESFGGTNVKSYMMGYVDSKESSTVLDILGVSVLDNPFTTKGIMIQRYDDKKCHTSTEAETLRYYPDKKVKKFGFDKNFSLINEWDGDYITGVCEIVGEDPSGYFIIIKNDKGPLFQRLAKEINEKLSLSLSLL